MTEIICIACTTEEEFATLLSSPSFRHFPEAWEYGICDDCRHDDGCEES